MNPDQLLTIAFNLASGTGRPGRPVDAELRRAVSTAYYAMFHALAQTCAALLGTNPSTKHAWIQLYGALEHGPAKSRCTGPSNVLQTFPRAVQNFASHFVKMQAHRHRADYDPTARLERAAVFQYIEETKTAIEDLNQAPRKDRRAFAVYVLFPLRRN